MGQKGGAEGEGKGCVMAVREDGCTCLLACSMLCVRLSSLL